jgi:hypothetical protein
MQKVQNANAASRQNQSLHGGKCMKRIMAMIIMLCLGLTSGFNLWEAPALTHADSRLVSHAEVHALRQELEYVKTRLDDTQKELSSLKQQFALRLPPPSLPMLSSRCIWPAIHCSAHQMPR